ncbi:transposase [Patescibacteria group bacterium]|nr:transposase [Patescibacteria group bacterium]
MSKRKVQFINDEYYHVYNRGVDKRIVFESSEDLERFFLSMQEFNDINPIGSIYEEKLIKNRIEKFGGSASKLSASDFSPKEKEKLVEFICYNLLPNHYHFFLKQLVDNGIQKFMHRISTGYTGFFNRKNKRNGSLFQGRYKAIHVNSNEYLLHLSTYINLNHQVHNLEKFGGSASKLFKSSWREYLGQDQKEICAKDIILDQFDSSNNYQKFSEEGLERIKESKEIQKYLLEELNN